MKKVTVIPPDLMPFPSCIALMNKQPLSVSEQYTALTQLASISKQYESEIAVTFTLSGEFLGQIKLSSAVRYFVGDPLSNSQKTALSNYDARVSLKSSLEHLLIRYDSCEDDLEDMSMLQRELHALICCSARRASSERTFRDGAPCYRAFMLSVSRECCKCFRAYYFAW